MMGYLLDDPDSRARIARAVPRKRIGTPEDVAGAVIFLSSRAGAFLTGVVHPRRRRAVHPRLRSPGGHGCRRLAPGPVVGAVIRLRRGSVRGRSAP